MQHPLRKPTSKAPSPEAQAAADIKERLTQYSNRWDVQATIKGTTDVAAPLQAAKGLVALMAHLHQQRGTCRRSEVRQHCVKQLSAALLLQLLSSSSRDTVTHTLQALLDYVKLFPGLLPVEVARQLLHLLGTGARHGVGAAKLLIEQLSHWRISQLLPEWILHNTTQQIYNQIRLQLPQDAAAAAGNSAGSCTSSSSSSSRSLDLCSSYLALLARVTDLAEQQIRSDLTGTAAAAGQWLELLVTLCRQHQQQQCNAAASQLLDSGCQLLAAVMNQSAAAAAALRSDQGLMMRLLEVLHKELQWTVLVGKAEEHVVLRWIHAAEAAAAAPVLWQPAAAAAAGSLQQQMLTDITKSVVQQYNLAPCGVSDTSNKRKLVIKTNNAALRVIAAGAMLETAAYGSSRRCSRFLPALLGEIVDTWSLLALLYMTIKDAADSAAAGNGAADSSSSSSTITATAAAAPEESSILLEVPILAAAAAAAAAGGGGGGGREGVLPWMVLRLICSQCAAAAAASQSQQLRNDMQVYAAFNCSTNGARDLNLGSAAQLLSKLQLLVCRAAQADQQQQQHCADLHSLNNPRSTTHSSSSNLEGSSDHAGDQTPQQQQQQQLTLQRLIQKMAPCWIDLGSLDLLRNSTTSSSSGSSVLGLSRQLVALSYVILSVSLTVSSAGSLGPPAAAAEIAVVLNACSIAAAVLKVLLPALLASSSSSADMVHHIEPAAAVDNATQQQQQQQQQQKQKPSSQPVRVIGVLECSLAAMQALVLLSKHIKVQLPHIPACIGGSSSTTPAAAAAAMNDLQSGLDDQLRQLLSNVVKHLPACTGYDAVEHSSSSSNGIDGTACAAAAANSGELLLQQIQQELCCWAAAALVTCYGQCGSSSSSGQGSMLAESSKQGSEFANAVLLLPSNLQQQQRQQLPIHAAVVAAGCPVLGKQLSAAAAAVGANARPLQIKVNASVDPLALQHALDYICTGTATVSNACLAAQLATAAAAASAHTAATAHSIQQQQRAARLNAAVQAVQQMQQQGQAELLALSRLSKKLQLPLLAALCKETSPQLGQQLLPMHPRLDALLPQKVIVTPLQLQQGGMLPQQQQQGGMLPQQQQQQQDYNSPQHQAGGHVEPCWADRDSAGASALTVEGPDRKKRGIPSSSSSSMDVAESAEMHSSCTRDTGNAVGAHSAATNDSNAGGKNDADGSKQHDGSQSYLNALSHFAANAPHTCCVAPMLHQQQQQGPQQQQQQQHVDQFPSSDPGLQFADVALAAPAFVQQQLTAALLPAHKVVLSGTCRYFEALCSDRWGMVGTHSGTIVRSKALCSDRWGSALHDHGGHADQADRADHAIQSDHADQADLPDHAHHAVYADHVDHAVHADHVDHAHRADPADHADQADRPDHSNQSDQAAHVDYADRADHANHPDQAHHADQADLADQADHIDQADHADYADCADHAHQAGHADHADCGVHTDCAERAEHESDRVDPGGNHQCFDDSADAYRAVPVHLQQQQQRQLRVVVVPEADIHVVAALQRWLYTGQLKVELPGELLIALQCPCYQQQRQQQDGQISALTRSCDGTHPFAGSGFRAVSDQHSNWLATSVSSIQHCSGDDSLPCRPQIQLSGCCEACHAARTLLRLWRCADLLLLPDLQQHCAAAAAAAARQLSCGCCLQLLSDCVNLGVAAAADGVITGVVGRFDKDTATMCLEWSTLGSALQDVLIRGWSSKQRLTGETHQTYGRRSSEGLGSGGHSGAVCGAGSPSILPDAPRVGQPSVSAHLDSAMNASNAQCCVVAVPESCVAGVSKAASAFLTSLSKY